MPASRFEFNKFSQQKSRPRNESGSSGFVHDTIIIGKQGSNRYKIGTLSTVAMTDNFNVLLKKWVF